MIARSSEQFLVFFIIIVVLFDSIDGYFYKRCYYFFSIVKLKDR